MIRIFSKSKLNLIQVYHKWTCDSETVATFCMRVHSCFVESERGNRSEMLDERGCALDRYVLNNLEYPADLMAGQVSDNKKRTNEKIQKKFFKKVNKTPQQFYF